MKKIIYFISVLLTCMCLNRNAQAILPDFTPLIPFAPQFCVMCIPPAVDWAYNTVGQVKEAKNRLKEVTNVTAIKQALTAYAAKLGNSAFNYAMQKLSARKKVISASRTILASQREGVDIHKEDSIKTDFVNLFLQYPSTKEQIQKAYRLKGDSLKTDTALEMYITANEMMKELCGVKGRGCEIASVLNSEEVNINSEFKDLSEMGMVLQVSLVEQCFMQGNYCDLIGMIGCEPSADGEQTASSEQPSGEESSEEDKVCYWKTALQVARIYDKIMRYNEMLIYMQAQYEAVSGINITAKIRAAKKQDKKDKSAFLTDEYLPNGSYFASETVSLPAAFADEKLSEEDAAEFAKYETNIANHENVLGGNFEAMDKAEGFESVLDDKDDDIASLQLLENIRQSLEEAKLYHNTKQMLPDYRKTFKNLYQTREYHKKTVEYLQESGECVKDYLDPYYRYPSSVWLGEGCDYYGEGMISCHYSPEKSVNDTAESQGLYDDICSDDTSKKCFVKKLEDFDFNKGISGALLAFYNEGKVADALQETQTYLKEGEQPVEVTFENGSSNSYTSQADVEGGEDTTGDKQTYVTGRDDSNMMDKDNANASEVLPSASSTQQTVAIAKHDKEADENLKDPEKGDSLTEETRKGHLMNWVWGSTMANIVMADLENGSSKFGASKSRFPLWNDKKEFYDQYIDGKYENVAKYMKRAAMPDGLVDAATEINNVLAYSPIVIHIRNEKGEVVQTVTVTAEMQRAAIAAVIEPVRSQFQVKDTAKDEIDAMVDEENSYFKSLKDAHKAKMNSLAQQKKAKQRELGAVNTSLDAANEQYNNYGEKVASSNNTTRVDGDNNEYNKELEDKYRTSVDTSNSPINKQFVQDKIESDNIKSEALVKRQTIKDTAEKLEQQSKRLADELQQIKKDIENERRTFVKTYSDAERKARLSFADEAAQFQAPVLPDSTVVSAMVSAIDEASAKMSAELSAQYNTSISINLPTTSAVDAGAMIECLRRQAEQIAMETRNEKMAVLKRNKHLYYPETASEVNSVHGEMISRIKSIDSCMYDGVSSVPIANKVFGEMCDAISCREAKIEKGEDDLIIYFVGEVGLLEDLQAPTPLVAFSSAPVREIFHFDIQDYNSIEKYYDGDLGKLNNTDITITGDGFLQLGEDMQDIQEDIQQDLGESATDENIVGTFPEIWKYILKRHAYNQKQIDLTTLLGNEVYGDAVMGDPVRSYLRSGSFPCYIDDNVVDTSAKVGQKAELSNLGYCVNQTSDISVYPEVECKGWTLVKGKAVDYATDGSLHVSDAPQPKGAISSTSELGNILAYVPDNSSDMIKKLFNKVSSSEKEKLDRKLTFNTALQKAVNVMYSTEELGKDKSKDTLFYMANRSLFDRNQFGDYLNQVEQEALARESLAKVENQIGEIYENLQDVFYGTDIIISEDFELYNPESNEDYEMAAQRLDEQKQIYLNKAEKELKEVKGISDTVKNKIKELENTIALLREDKDEIVKLNGSEDIARLREKIANQSADNAVSEEYEKMGDEAFEQRMRQLQPPFCSVSPFK